ncbi:MAG: hypothetical protein HY300_02055 [Verrucomicrobia bacterium]|nr:hypothetical protein [Verrucomicrobiota bacterium]
MGFLNIFSKTPSETKLERLPSGSFTLDRNGRVIASTLPASFPEELRKQIGGTVLEAFISAREAKLPLTELHAHFGGLKLTAKEQRGGAMIMLAPAR